MASSVQTLKVSANFMHVKIVHGEKFETFICDVGIRKS